MIKSLQRFKLVILDYPLYAFDDAFCTALLGKALKMKYEGYTATYNDSVLPMDKTDFFGTHIIFCEDKGNELFPIFAYKSTPLNRCYKYGMEFPALTLMKKDGHPDCVGDLLKIISKVGDPSLISYDSSWAQALNYRFSGDPEMKLMLREIMFMVIVRHHQEFQLPHMVTCGAVKVKTDLFFLNLGLKKLNEHSHFIQEGLNNEESVIFYNDSFSEEAMRLAEKHSKIWDSKIVKSGLDRAGIKIAA